MRFLIRNRGTGVFWICQIQNLELFFFFVCVLVYRVFSVFGLVVLDAHFGYFSGLPASFTAFNRVDFDTVSSVREELSVDLAFDVFLVFFLSFQVFFDDLVVCFLDRFLLFHGFLPVKKSPR